MPIIAGESSEGESLGHEPDLVERFGVSRPSPREALRILEAEGFITVVRGVRGGVVVHEPDERRPPAPRPWCSRPATCPSPTCSRPEPSSSRSPPAIARLRARRKSIVKELKGLVDAEEAALEDPEAFGVANAAFHENLVALAGNQTLTHRRRDAQRDRRPRRDRRQQGPRRHLDARGAPPGIRSQHRLLKLLLAGDGAAAEEHWRTHMTVVAKVMLGQESATVVDLLHHD